jgi:hypothetical protein
MASRASSSCTEACASAARAASTAAGCRTSSSAASTTSSTRSPPNAMQLGPAAKVLHDDLHDRNREMLPLHLTAPLLPRPASLPKAGFAMLQGQTTQQLAPLPPQSDSRQPRPTSRPGSPEHEQRQRPRGCTAPPNRSPARSPREREQFAQPRVANSRQWQSRRRLQYCGSCGVEFYNPVRRHSALDFSSPAQFEKLATE